MKWSTRIRSTATSIPNPYDQHMEPAKSLEMLKSLGLKNISNIGICPCSTEALGNFSAEEMIREDCRREDSADQRDEVPFPLLSSAGT